MANSKHLQIRNALALLLLSNVPVAEKVTTGRRVAVADQDSEQVFVYLDTSLPDRAQLGGQPDDWKTRVRIELAARQLGGDDAEDRADALATDAYGRVMADPSLGGLCMDCYPVGIAWSTDEAEAGLAVAQIVFEAKHRTSATTIAA